MDFIAQLYVTEIILSFPFRAEKEPAYGYCESNVSV